MTQEDVEILMQHHLKDWNDEGVEISPETVHKEVLSATDGYKKMEVFSSKNIYQIVVRGAILRRAKKEGLSASKAVKLWPANWMQLTVRELATRIMPLLLFLALSLSSSSQLSVQVSAAKTELGKDALKIALSYLYSLDSIFSARDLFITGKNSYFQIQPQFDIQTGTADAFSSIQAKLTGALLTFKNKEVSGFETADLSRLFWLFPISVGAETDNTFRRVNGIFEIGAAPYWHTATSSAPEWLKQIKLAGFLQAGYKFRRDTLGDIGGEIDESLENENDFLLRVKAGIEANIIKPVQISGFRFGLVGAADVWYDIANGSVYHKINGEGRFFVTGENFMSLFYEHGSGAPNFNTGSQFGIGLTINF